MTIDDTGVETTMVSCVVRTNGTALESTSCTEKLKVPADVGVPVMAPVVALKLRPGGSDPEAMLRVSGAVPPAGFKLAVYATPTVPAGGVPASVGSGLTVIVTEL